jgi:hypothetical protein
MKTSCPNYKLPKRVTEHNGALSFGTDAWTSPNHKAYVAITVHFEHNGVPICLLLNIVQVVCSHTRINLAKAFASVLDDFGITDKVNKSLSGPKKKYLPRAPTDTLHHL